MHGIINGRLRRLMAQAEYGNMINMIMRERFFLMKNREIGIIVRFKMIKKLV